MKDRGFTLIELMIVIAIIAIIAAIAIPNLLAARKSANETSAVGALRTVGSSQQVFRDTGKSQDGACVAGRYAWTFSILANPNQDTCDMENLLGEVFDTCSPTKAGYAFGSSVSTAMGTCPDGAFQDPVSCNMTTPPTACNTNFKYGWAAYAGPVDQGNTGDRYFYASHAGDILFAATGCSCTAPCDYSTTPGCWQAID